MVMSVSKKISKFKFQTQDEEFNCMNLEPTELRGLKMLSFVDPVFTMVQWTHILTELEARPEFNIEYRRDWSIEMAEKLDWWLTLPNFKWDLIEAESDEEYERAVQLCTKNGINLNRISY